MINTINSPENELRVRIKNGFESGSSSKKIMERPKTPRFINKDSTSVKISKKNISVQSKQSKTELQQEIAVLKNKDISKQTKTSKKELDNNIPIYICYKCDKKYKSKRGVIKHMEKCTYGKTYTKKIIT